MRSIKKGATSQTVYFEFLDSTSTTGGRKTGLVYNSSGISAYYVRNGGSAVAITLATLAAANSAWATGGFKEVDATNMPGLYRLDVPDAAFASGADGVVITMRGATGMAQASLEIQLVDNITKDVFDRLGAPVGASLSADLQVVGGYVDTEIGTMQTAVTAIKTKTDQLAFTVAGQVDANVFSWKGATAPAMTGDAYARLGGPAGASIAADIAAIKAVLPTALVGGRMDCSIGAVAAGAITGSSFAAGAFDNVWTVASRVLTAGTNIVLAKGVGVTGFNDLDAAGVRGAVGLASANLGTQLSTISLQIPSDVTIADTVLGRTVETGFSMQGSLRLMLAALTGRISGGGTTAETVRDINNTKNRIVYTVDVNGNRTNVVVDAT